jgi:hypothetical protein
LFCRSILAEVNRASLDNTQALPGATRLVDLYASRGMRPRSTGTSERNSR